MFVDIKGFQSHQVNSMGEVRTKKSGRISKGTLTRYGYRLISTSISGKTAQMFVHRAVALSFIGEIPEGMVINHLDGDKQNNAVGNLQITTYRENSVHAIRNNLQPNTLSSSMILKAVDMWRSGKKTGEISKVLGVSTRTITSIINGDSYSHTTGIKNRVGRAYGVRSGTSKFDEETIKKIKLKLLMGYKVREICTEYSVHRNYIGKIVRNEIWKSVTI